MYSFQSKQAAIVHAYACVHSVKRVCPCICVSALLRERTCAFVIKHENAFKRKNVLNVGACSVRKHSGFTIIVLLICY